MADVLFSALLALTRLGYPVGKVDGLYGNATQNSSQTF